MKFKKAISALLVCVMVFALMPLGVAAYNYDQSGFYPTVNVSFTRDVSNPTTGTLTVASISNVPGYFCYTASTSPTALPVTPIYISAYETSTITLTNIPANSYYYVCYYTYGNAQSATETYVINPYSGSGINPSAVSIISSYRSGINSTTVKVSLSVNEPCVLYYGLSSATIESTQYILYNTGIQEIEISNIDIRTNVLFYKTVSYTGVTSAPGSFTIGGSSSGMNYPNLTNYSLYSTMNGSGTFNYTSDKAGYLYYVVSTTPVYYIDTTSYLNSWAQINSGTGSFNITNQTLSATGARLYFVTADNYGNKSQVQSIAVNTSSATTGYPILTNYYLTSTNAGYGTFNYTADKAGLIYYVVSTTPVYSIDTTSYATGSAQINSGSGSFAVANQTLSAVGARLYFITSDINGNKSQIQSIAVNSGSQTAGYPVLSNVFFSVTATNPYNGTLTFNSNMSGYLCYAVTSSTNGTKTTLQFNYYPIVSGANTVSISTYSTSVSLFDMRLYYFTAGNNYNESALSYVFPNSSSSNTDTTISEVAITGVVAPVAGMKPSSSYTIINNDARFTVSNVGWYLTQNFKLSGDDRFQAGSQYYITLTLNAKTGYSFPSNNVNFTSTINGKSATVLSYTTSSVTIAYLFDSVGTASGTEITSVAVNNIDEPAAGNVPDTSGTTASTAYKIKSVTWSPSVNKFVNGNSYTVNVTLTPATGYTFKIKNGSLKIGARDASIVYNSDEGNLLVISCTYKLDGTPSGGTGDTEWVNPFTDVPDNSHYYVYIKYCYLNNLFYGTSATTFGPTTTMNRAMFVTVLGRLAGVDVTSYKTNKFSDVVANSWYAPYVAWAAQNGIVLGYDNGKFGPNDPVTREQMCEFLRRYATKCAGIKLGYTEKVIGFSDASKISTWATEAISIFEQAGVAVSKPNSTAFEPRSEALRQEIAEMLILFMMKYMNG